MVRLQSNLDPYPLPSYIIIPAMVPAAHTYMDIDMCQLLMHPVHHRTAYLALAWPRRCLVC